MTIGETYPTWGPAHNVLGARETGSTRVNVPLKNTDTLRVRSVNGDTTRAELVTNDFRNGKEIHVPTIIFTKPEGW